MNDAEFKKEVSKVKLKIAEKPADVIYWESYLNGLRHGYQGEGTREEHKKWVLLAGHPDKSISQQGEGYRDGLAKVGITFDVGRPKTFPGETSVTIGTRIPKSVFDTIPEPRSDWVRKLIMKNLPKSKTKSKEGDT